jgi:Fic family protein
MNSQNAFSLKELEAIDAFTKRQVGLARASKFSWPEFVENFTFDTNAIEGSTLTLAEVKSLLERGKWPNRVEGDVYEALGVAEAVKHLRTTGDALSLNLIKELHRIVFQNSKSFAGKLRHVEVAVIGRRGVIHQGAPAVDVPRLLRELVSWYHTNESRVSPLLLAAEVHARFEIIHPFEDGNGRVGRLLLINILLKNGLSPINIEMENRREYYEAIQLYEDQGNLRPTIKLMIKEYKKLW